MTDLVNKKVNNFGVSIKESLKLKLKEIPEHVNDVKITTLFVNGWLDINQLESYANKGLYYLSDLFREGVVEDRSACEIIYELFCELPEYEYVKLAEFCCGRSLIETYLTDFEEISYYTSLDGINLEDYVTHEEAIVLGMFTGFQDSEFIGDKVKIANKLGISKEEVSRKLLSAKNHIYDHSYELFKVVELEDGTCVTRKEADLAKDDPYDMSLDSLRLPIKAYNSLRKAGINTVKDLKQCIQEGSLQNIKGVGKTSIDAVMSSLAEWKKSFIK